MKAVRIVDAKQLKLVEIGAPKPDGKWVNVKVDTVGICGSDLHYWAAGDSMTKNWILGHEFSGTVTDVGSRKDLTKGDRVVVIPSKACDGCEYCRNGRNNLCEVPITTVVGNGAPEGAFSEYIAVRPETALKLEDNVSFEEASMIEPCSVGLHALNRAKILAGERLLIAGAGIIGLMTAMWARKKGVKYIAISEVGAARLEMAKRFGFADEVFDAKDPDYLANLKKASDGQNFDKLIDCVGIEQTLNTNMLAVKPDGMIVMVGIPVHPITFNIPPFIIREQNMTTVHGYVTSEFRECLRLLTNGELNLKQFITDIRPLDQAQSAFEALAAPDTNHVKILLKP